MIAERSLASEEGRMPNVGTGGTGGKKAGDALLRCIMTGFVDQLCVRRDLASLECELTEGRRGTLMRESVVQNAPLFVAASIRELPGVSDVYIPQDIDYPSLRLDIDRERAGELGLDQREVVNNVITALTSNQMIAPSFWVDPRSGNDYMLTVQYPEDKIRSLRDLRGIPLHSGRIKDPTMLDAVTKITPEHPLYKSFFTVKGGKAYGTCNGQDTVKAMKLPKNLGRD
jgi:hypothetical protein